MLDAFLYLLIFGSLVFLVIVTTKFVAKKAKKVMKGQYINIIESVSLGMDKKLHIIKAGDEFVLIASTNKSIEFLTTLKLDEYSTDEIPEIDNSFDFKSIFDKYIQNFKNSKDKRKMEIDRNDDLVEPNEGQVFKSNLDKLRSITYRADKINVSDGDDKTNEK